jgi:hypothetical protein
MTKYWIMKNNLLYANFKSRSTLLNVGSMAHFVLFTHHYFLKQLNKVFSTWLATWLAKGTL